MARIHPSSNKEEEETILGSGSKTRTLFQPARVVAFSSFLHTDILSTTHGVLFSETVVSYCSLALICSALSQVYRGFVRCRECSPLGRRGWLVQRQRFPLMNPSSRAAMTLVARVMEPLKSFSPSRVISGFNYNRTHPVFYASSKGRHMRSSRVIIWDFLEPKLSRKRRRLSARLS